MNPKDLVGAKKAPMDLVPAAGAIMSAPAHKNGADKYGPFNWRQNPVQLMTYLAAIRRHLDAFVDGQDLAEDTGIHHLSHMQAGMNIIADAMYLGNLIDNRPPKGPAADMLRLQDHSAKATPLLRPEVVCTCVDLPRNAEHRVGCPRRGLMHPAGAWLRDPMTIGSEAWLKAKSGTSGFLAEGSAPTDSDEGRRIMAENAVLNAQPSTRTARPSFWCVHPDCVGGHLDALPDGYCPECGQPVLEASHLITCPAYGS